MAEVAELRVAPTVSLAPCRSLNAWQPSGKSVGSRTERDTEENKILMVIIEGVLLQHQHAQAAHHLSQAA